MEKENFLIERIGRCQTILQEVRSGKAWGYLLEDFSKTKETIDDNWHLVSDPIKLAELRVSKMALNTILNTISTYEHDLGMAERELASLRNPREMVHKDYDNEGIGAN